MASLSAQSCATPKPALQKMLFSFGHTGGNKCQDTGEGKRRLQKESYEKISDPGASKHTGRNNSLD